MKHLLFLLFLAIGFSTTAVAQKRKKRIPEPPIITDKAPAIRSENGENTPSENYIMPPVPVRSPKMATETDHAAGERLLTNAKSLPVAFLYEVDADTVIRPDEIFRKQLIISPHGIRMQTTFATDTLRLTSRFTRAAAANHDYAEGADTLLSPEESLVFLNAQPPQKRVALPRTAYTSFTMKVVDETAVLTNTETGEVHRFKLYLNLQRTKITGLFDMDKRETYKPASFL